MRFTLALAVVGGVAAQNCAVSDPMKVRSWVALCLRALLQRPLVQQRGGGSAELRGRPSDNSS